MEPPPGNNAPIPDKLKQLRACLSCKLIKTTEQWREGGCENCVAEDKFNGIDSMTYTTPTFKGSEKTSAASSITRRTFSSSSSTDGPWRTDSQQRMYCMNCTTLRRRADSDSNNLFLY